MSKLTVAASLLLVVGLVVGCGADKPADASEQDFCTACSDVTTALTSSAADSATSVPAATKAVASLAATGTPESTPEAARQGFELFTSTIEDLDDDVTEDELTQIGGAMSAADKDTLTAFWACAQETCVSSTEGSN